MAKLGGRRTLVIGIDSGTQSTKALLLDVDRGKILAIATKAYELLPGLPPGAKEQHPHTWRDAVKETIKSVLKKANVKPGEVKAIGVSGQQHGFVPLDEKGEVVRPAKLWCDTSTTEECEELTKLLGGPKSVIKLIGNPILPGYTASKILWLKKHEPANFARVATVLLPHDYINFWLTGQKVMEYGDASGTALMDVRRRQWCRKVVEAIDSSLLEKLPPLIPSDRPVGTLLPQIAEELGLTSDVVVSAGGGDNMMGAIGTGNTRPGVVTASFGTSGTIYACSEKPVIDPKGEIAAFCDSTNRWLPLVCTMNVTVTTEMIRKHYGWTHQQMEQMVRKAPVGAAGLIILPYLEGERTPNVPDGTGVMLGVNLRTMNPAYLMRAAMEGVTLGMNYGLRRLKELGVMPTQIRVTGGGSKSKVWRQIIADIFNAEVITLEIAEGAAFGAALQAWWCYLLQKGEKVKIEEITDHYVKINRREKLEPISEHVKIYQELQAIQDELSLSLRKLFSTHRKYLLTYVTG